MVSIKLSKPINHDGKTYDTVEVDEPSVGGVEALENAVKAGAGEAGCTIAMLAVDTGIPADALRKMRVSDLKKVMEAMAPFVEAAKPPSGPTGVQSAPTSPQS